MKWGNKRLSPSVLIVSIALCIAPFGLLYLGVEELDRMSLGDSKVVEYTGVCSENSTVPPCRKDN